MQSEFSKGLGKAYRLLAYRDRTSFEIQEALKKKNFTANTIDLVIAKLTELKYLNDEKFAIDFGKSLARRRKVGPNYIINNLYKKGVSRDKAEEAVEIIFENSTSFEDEIDYWIQKKLNNKRKTVEPVKLKKRIFDLLLRKGFAPDAVFKAFEKWNL